MEQLTQEEKLKEEFYQARGLKRLRLASRSTQIAIILGLILGPTAIFLFVKDAINLPVHNGVEQQKLIR